MQTEGGYTISTRCNYTINRPRRILQQFKCTVSLKSVLKYFYQEAPVAGIQTTVQQIREEGMGVILGGKDITHFDSNGSLEIFIKIKENKLSKTEIDDNGDAKE